MMHRITFIFLLIFSSIISFGQGIEFFEGSWDEALNEAREDDKVIFVDAYAKWCGPCKKMAKDVFTQDRVGRFFNERFINIKMDMEEPDGIKFGRNYPVGAFPTLFFLDSEGNVLQKSVGGKQADALLALADKAIRSYDRTGQFEERYVLGERDFDLMINYVSELNKVGKTSQKIANEYLNSKPDISKEQKAEFLLVAVKESDSKLFDQLVSLKKLAISVSSADKYERTIANAAMRTVEKAFDYDYPALLDEAIDQFNAAAIGDSKRFEMEARLYYAALTGDYQRWESLSQKFIKKYGKKNPGVFKEQLSQINKYFDYEQDAYKYAYVICEKLIKEEENSSNYIQYLRLLMNDKQYEKAMELCKKALKIFKEDSMYKQFEDMMRYLEMQNME